MKMLTCLYLYEMNLVPREITTFSVIFNNQKVLFLVNWVRLFPDFVSDASTYYAKNAIFRILFLNW